MDDKERTVVEESVDTYLLAAMKDFSVVLQLSNVGYA